jgi:translation initiation factor 5
MSRPGAIVNIAGTTPVDDPEYRYKMPVVYGKIEGRGNGIKTVIPNIADVALSLHRPPGEVNKFFGCELGAQTTYSAETDRAVVNGAHTDATLQTLIHRYIEVFVLCPQCGLPETDYKIKNDCIYHKCAACGNKEMVDMQHKLCTYILAQDKKAKKEAKTKKGKKEKEEKKKSKPKTKEDSDEDGKKKKKKTKDKKDKKKDKKDKKADAVDGSNHLEDAIFGKKSDSFEDDGDEEASLASEPGVDDAGAMSKLQ